MTIADVKASPIGETFDWVDLRVSNGTEETDITTATLTYRWIDYDFQYWDTTESQFESIYTGQDREYINSWEGIFVYSYKPNIYLLTNNETKQNKIKVKCNAKFIGADGVCKMPSGKAKYVGDNKIFKFKAFSSHIIRLIGSLRTTKG